MIIHGLVLVDPSRPPRPGWVRLDGDRVAEVGDGASPERPHLGGPSSLVCPGFIDAHLHLPQIDAIGCDGMELLEWLGRVIYPAEERWRDPDAARTQVISAYGRLLDAGTLGFAGYLSSHAHGLAETVRVAHRMPLRSIVGQVLMDREAPEALLGQPPARLLRSRRGRFDASVNPRFAIACTDGLLEAAGRRAAGGAVVQTHIAESPAECRRVAELFPGDPHYAGVYDRHGLLTARTLLAHGVHLSHTEWDLVAERDCVVVHCPSANTFLRSGLFDLAAATSRGVRIALGSDVAAGPDLAMPRVARAMIEVAKTRAMTLGSAAPVPSPADAWAMITRGNADALGWPDAGRLEAGAAADLLVLEPPFGPDEHLVGRLIYTWRDDYIRWRVVAGKVVGGS